ncbi:MAG: Mps one binder kinase activator-like 1A, partial [Olpidium bornovanus]
QARQGETEEERVVVVAGERPCTVSDAAAGHDVARQGQLRAHRRVPQVCQRERLARGEQLRVSRPAASFLSLFSLPLSLIFSLVRVVGRPDVSPLLLHPVFDFFHYLNLFYGTVSNFCTTKDCPNMSAGAGVEFQWVDAQKKSLKLPAPQYIDYVMTWIQNTLDDESVFPTKVGHEFPRDFPATSKQMFRQMFRVFAHIYHHHFATVLHLCEEAHLNSLFAHFMSFSRCFDLLDRKETAPLADLISDMESAGLITA